MIIYKILSIVILFNLYTNCETCYINKDINRVFTDKDKNIYTKVLVCPANKNQLYFEAYLILIIILSACVFLPILINFLEIFILKITIYFSRLKKIKYVKSKKIKKNKILPVQKKIDTSNEWIDHFTKKNKINIINNLK